VAVTQVQRSFRGVSADDRRAERRTRLVDACIDVIGADGIANTTMTAVCKRAGLTERYFYESFANRDQLLVAVFDSMVREVGDRIVAALAAAPNDLAGRARIVSSIIVDVLADDPRIARAYHEAVGADVLRQRRRDAVRIFAGFLARMVADAQEFSTSDDAKPLRASTLMIVGGMIEVVDAWLDGYLQVTKDELIDDCALMCVAAADQFVGRG
jgi:AcrR family transcriptional regulator